MKKEKLVPEIRFKGFEEEWNQKVINQTLIPVISTLTMSNVQGKGEILLFDANSIVGYSSYALSSVPYLTIIKDGAGVGRIRKLPGNSAFLGTMTGLIPRNVDIDFIHSLISTLSLEKSFSGSTIPHIYFSDYGKLKIYIPYFSEQQKIGQFFSSIDSLIQSQELKLKKLNEIKQSLLSKMFASENQKFPEIRFKGFKEEWKLTTFDELINFASEGGTPSTFNNEFYKNGNIPFIKIEETKNKYIFDAEIYINIHGINNSSAWVIPSNSLLLTNGATIGNVAINKKEICTKQGILGIIPSLSMDLEFFYYLLKNKYFQKELKNKSVTGTFASISLPIIKTILLSVSQKDEQQKIGQFFSNLDSLIQSQELKLEKLNNIKQALLEKMFC
ncbi:restriction endonuclease subunit S [Mycoplasma sp. VS403A]|uniref:restriction endonuclease subunit S n=1 Tax=Mycoplasma sp. VS403A TaxID=3401668 RepID=UPI003AADD27C